MAARTSDLANGGARASRLDAELEQVAVPLAGARGLRDGGQQLVHLSTSTSHAQVYECRAVPFTGPCSCSLPLRYCTVHMHPYMTCTEYE